MSPQRDRQRRAQRRLRSDRGVRLGPWHDHHARPANLLCRQCPGLRRAPVKPLTVGFSSIDYKVTEGTTATLTAKLSKPSSDPVTVQYPTTFGSAIPNRDYTAGRGTLTFPPNITLQSFTVQTIDNGKYQGERGVLVELSNPTGGAALGLPPIARVTILDNETYDPTLLDDFETYPLSLDGGQKGGSEPTPRLRLAILWHCLAREHMNTSCRPVQKNGKGTYKFGRTFPIAQDWSDSGGLNFWYYGRNTGKNIQVSLANTRPTSATRRVETGLDRRIQQQGRHRAQRQHLGPGSRRRHRQRHPRLGQQRTGILHRRHEQRRHRWQRQPAHHRQKSRWIAAVLLRARASTPRPAC